MGWLTKTPSFNWDNIIPLTAMIQHVEVSDEDEDEFTNIKGDLTCSILDADLEAANENLKIIIDFLEGLSND